MATKARKPAAAKSRATPAKATQAKAGAGPAIAARSKDTKPAFGKAAPKKVVPGVAAKVAAKPAKAKKPAGSSSPVGTMRNVANVAAGAVVATARGAASLASSVMGRGGSKAKAKAK